MTNLIIISLWIERSIKPLINLLKQIDEIEAGVPFEVAIVCNTDDLNYRSFSVNLNSKSVKILPRENKGFNIGAWDYGWRNLPPYDHYLFLQDDCFIIRKQWLKAFVTKFYEDSNIGLLGESLNWQFTWDELQQSSYNNFHRQHNLNGKRVKRVDFYRHFLASHQIDEGKTAEHLQSIILFTSRKILEEMDGFIIGNNYGEAIGSEIAISKKVQNLGYKIQSVNPNSYYHYIAHPQWFSSKKRVERLIYAINSRFNRWL